MEAVFKYTYNKATRFKELQQKHFNGGFVVCHYRKIIRWPKTVHKLKEICDDTTSVFTKKNSYDIGHQFSVPILTDFAP